MARTRSITSIEAEISKVSSELKQAQEKADALFTEAPGVTTNEGSL